MQKIRHGVFETNSSSCHSISISNSGNYDSISPDKDGVIHVYAGEFGWAQDTFSDPISKLSYLLIYIRDWVDSQEDKTEFMNKLLQVVKDQTHCDRIEFPTDSGYIDHQSVECNDLHYMFEHAQTLKDFVFGRDSYIETDNDNH